MNNPEYILVEEIGSLVASVKTALGISVLNYQYGYLSELRETLTQMEAPGFDDKKYPLVWLVQPFTIKRNDGDFYGDAKVRMFIIAASQKTLKADARMTQTFKPVIYPIYRTIIDEILKNTTVFNTEMNRVLSHTVTDRYYWGEEQAQLIGDVFDCMEINNLELQIKNNNNCSILKSF